MLIQFGQFCMEGCEGQPTDSLDVLSPDAALRGKLQLAGILDPGALAFDSAGYIYEAGFPDGGQGNVHRYPHSGGAGAAFLQLDPGVELAPTAMMFSAAGTLYAAGRRYTPADSAMGVFRYTSTGQPSPLGEQVPAAPIDDASGYGILGIGLSGCTLAYGGPDQIKRYDTCTDQQLDDFPTPPGSNARGLRGYADGTFISVEGTEVKHILPDGTVQSFPDENGCAMSADAYAGYLYVLDACLHRIERFDLATGQSLGVWKEYSEEEIAARGAYPVRIQVYDRTAPPKPILYVHGVTTGFEAPSFDSLFQDSAIASSVIRFDYFQDLGPVHPCLRALPTVESSTEMPVDLASANQTVCDSQSDIGINAVALRDFVREQFAASGGQRVILVGFSMGASIIRGFLGYSTALGDGTATDMVDSVIFIEGAHDGSYLLVTPNTISGAASILGSIPGVQQFVEDWVTDQAARFNFDFQRPAATELNPASSWYAWANSPNRPLPGNIGYYNAYGAIDLKARVCAWDWFGISWCHEPHVLDIGDGLLLPGTDDPYDGPTPLHPERLWGGARFSRPTTAEQWEWPLYHKFVIHPLNLSKDPKGEAQRLVAAIGAAPELHMNISSQSASTYVFDCTTGATTGLNQQLLKILKGKIGQEAYACPLH
jgi:hypothetical protein